MAQITGARNFISVPPVEQAHTGVMSIATVIDVTDGDHSLLGAEYETDACADAHVWLDFCLDDDEVKEFANGPDQVVGDPFAVYAAVECEMTRMDVSMERAERRLAYAEGRQVDEHIRQLLAADVDTVSIGPGPNPVAEGIALLEGYAATVYGAVPTLIMQRSMVICACAAHVVCACDMPLESFPRTCLGTPIAAIAGDPESPDPEAEIYITGRIVLLRGPVKTYLAAPTVNNDGTYEPHRALAERIYVPLIECLAGKTLVTCS